MIEEEPKALDQHVPPDETLEPLGEI